MSMPHKAYVFNFVGFQTELEPLLYAALKTNELTALEQWVDANRESLTSLEYLEPLSENWRDELPQQDHFGNEVRRDAHMVGDLALTKYYEPSDDEGLDTEWSQVQSELNEEQQAALLGVPIGPEENLFDPGKLGSYFQDFEGVKDSLAILLRANVAGIDRFIQLLIRARDSRMGLYVTF